MDNDFFGICIPLARFICIMPDKRPQNLRSKLYNLLVYGLAIFCHLTELVKLCQILTDEYFVLGEFIRNYVITSLHFTSLVKSLFVSGEISTQAFKHVMEFEQNVYKNMNEDIRLIYRKKVASIQKVKKYYIIGIILVVLFYHAAPVFRGPISIQNGNETIRIRQVPLSSWSPVEQYYWLAFVWSGFAGYYLSVFFVTTDLICYSFIAFGACQLEILQYNIRNFDRNCEDIMQVRGWSKGECARVLQKELIRTHQEIINYIKMINSGIKNLMVLDFLPGSVQLAGIIFQMMANLNVVQWILLGQFVCSLIARVFLYTNSAHNLGQISQQLAADWFEIDWIDLPKDVKVNLSICILRSQKSLRITVGDISIITMDSFLAVLKGTYSYLMLLMAI